MTPQQEAREIAEKFIGQSFTFLSAYGNMETLCAYDLGYRFRFNNKKRAVGTCSYRNKTIELSLPIILSR